jgi:hypothetical protein
MIVVVFRPKNDDILDRKRMMHVMIF